MYACEKEARGDAAGVVVGALLGADPRERGAGGERKEEKRGLPTWPTPFLKVVTKDCTRMRMEGFSLGNMIWMQGKGKEVSDGGCDGSSCRGDAEKAAKKRRPGRDR